MRKDRILAYVVDKCRTQQPEEGVTTQEIADALSIWRNDVAVELNKLVAEGKLRREGKKNIRFFPPMDRPRISPHPPPRKRAPQPFPNWWGQTAA